ncbi:unnamed protein product [Mytilus coruscus]|uniref:Uncharacterized protein n=1 Tax=Mytilus coruscus TaxID=42192 RepID=A0A6J8DJ97_MYTCO|nr:unnamed protein product [Mytilus coruscus]
MRQIISTLLWLQHYLRLMRWCHCLSKNRKSPTVASAGSSEDWTYFVSRWKDYIQETKVSGTDLVIQLLECCDETLRRFITRSAEGLLVGESEQKVLRTLAVREEKTMVARVSLYGMTQDRDETALKPPLVHTVEDEMLTLPKTRKKTDNNQVELCGCSGKNEHGKSAPPKIRKKECPAYGHTCKNCEQENHYESVCRSNASQPKVKPKEDT